MHLLEENIYTKFLSKDTILSL